MRESREDKEVKLRINNNTIDNDVNKNQYNLNNSTISKNTNNYSKSKTLYKRLNNSMNYKNKISEKRKEEIKSINKLYEMSIGDYYYSKHCPEVLKNLGTNKGEKLINSIQVFNTKNDMSKLFVNDMLSSKGIISSVVNRSFFLDRTGNDIRNNKNNSMGKIKYNDISNPSNRISNAHRIVSDNTDISRNNNKIIKIISNNTDNKFIPALSNQTNTNNTVLNDFEKNKFSNSINLNNTNTNNNNNYTINTLSETQRYQSYYNNSTLNKNNNATKVVLFNNLNKSNKESDNNIKNSNNTSFTKLVISKKVANVSYNTTHYQGTKTSKNNISNLNNITNTVNVANINNINNINNNINHTSIRKINSYNSTSSLKFNSHAKNKNTFNTFYKQNSIKANNNETKDINNTTICSNYCPMCQHCNEYSQSQLDESIKIIRQSKSIITKMFEFVSAMIETSHNLDNDNLLEYCEERFLSNNEKNSSNMMNIDKKSEKTKIGINKEEIKEIKECNNKYELNNIIETEASVIRNKEDMKEKNNSNHVDKCTHTNSEKHSNTKHNDDVNNLNHPTNSVNNNKSMSSLKVKLKPSIPHFNKTQSSNYLSISNNNNNINLPSFLANNACIDDNKNTNNTNNASNNNSNLLKLNNMSQKSSIENLLDKLPKALSLSSNLNYKIVSNYLNALIDNKIDLKSIINSNVFESLRKNFLSTSELYRTINDRLTNESDVLPGKFRVSNLSVIFDKEMIELLDEKSVVFLVKELNEIYSVDNKNNFKESCNDTNSNFNENRSSNGKEEIKESCNIDNNNRFFYYDCCGGKSNIDGNDKIEFYDHTENNNKDNDDKRESLYHRSKDIFFSSGEVINITDNYNNKDKDNKRYTKNNNDHHNNSTFYKIKDRIHDSDKYEISENDKTKISSKEANLANINAIENTKMKNSTNSLNHIKHNKTDKIEVISEEEENYDENSIVKLRRSVFDNSDNNSNKNSRKSVTTNIENIKKPSGRISSVNFKLSNNKTNRELLNSSNQSSKNLDDNEEDNDQEYNLFTSNKNTTHLNKSFSSNNVSNENIKIINDKENHISYKNNNPPNHPVFKNQHILTYSKDTLNQLSKNPISFSDLQTTRKNQLVIFTVFLQILSEISITSKERATLLYKVFKKYFIETEKKTLLEKEKLTRKLEYYRRFIQFILDKEKSYFTDIDAINDILSSYKLSKANLTNHKKITKTLFKLLNKQREKIYLLQADVEIKEKELNTYIYDWSNIKHDKNVRKRINEINMKSKDIISEINEEMNFKKITQIEKSLLVNSQRFLQSSDLNNYFSEQKAFMKSEIEKLRLLFEESHQETLKLKSSFLADKNVLNEKLINYENTIIELRNKIKKLTTTTSTQTEITTDEFNKIIRNHETVTYLKAINKNKFESSIERVNYSISKVKALDKKALLFLIPELYNEKVINNMRLEMENKPKECFDVFFNNYLKDKFKISKIVRNHLESCIKAIIEYSVNDSRIACFGKFLGVNGKYRREILDTYLLFLRNLPVSFYRLFDDGYETYLLNAEECFELFFLNLYHFKFVGALKYDVLRCIKMYVNNKETKISNLIGMMMNTKKTMVSFSFNHGNGNNRRTNNNSSTNNNVNNVNNLNNNRTLSNNLNLSVINFSEEQIKLDILMLVKYYHRSAIHINLIYQDYKDGKDYIPLVSIIEQFQMTNKEFEMSVREIEELFERNFIVDKRCLLIESFIEFFNNRNFSFKINLFTFVNLTLQKIVYVYKEMEKIVCKVFDSVDISREGYLTIKGFERVISKLIFLSEKNNWKITRYFNIALNNSSRDVVSKEEFVYFCLNEVDLISNLVPKIRIGWSNDEIDKLEIKKSKMKHALEIVEEKRKNIMIVKMKTLYNNVLVRDGGRGVTIPILSKFYELIYDY